MANKDNGSEAMERERRQWAARAGEARNTVAAAAADQAALVGQFVETTNGDRRKLLAKWAELGTVIEAGRAELQELERRAHGAHVAILQAAVDSAAAAYAEAAGKAREAKRAMETAGDAQRHMLNRGGRHSDTPEAARERVETTVAFERAKIESVIAGEEAERVGRVLQEAQQALAEVAGAH